ncbi:MAG: exo-alpha-sialidase, partial [Ruminococcaceae bacterium]|nr:exo-alpha-sialidase [Oscillospiraceae bacterium]
MKKLYSVLLVLAMVLGMIPATAAAGPAKFDTAALAVGDKVLYAKYSAATVEDGALTEAPWQTNITLSAGVKFGAVWDSETLYLGFAGTAAPAAPTAITVNGKSVTRAGVAGAAAREIRIPLSEVGINIDDFDPAVKLSVTAAGATWEGTLVFDSVEGGAVNQFPTTKTETDATVTYNKETETLHFVGEGSETVLVRHNGFAGDKAGIYNAAVGDMFKIIDSANPPVAFEFDVKVDYLPEFKRHYTSAAQKEICPGLYFSVTGKSYCDDGTVANTLTSGMTFGITYMGENLILSVRATDFKNGDIYAETTQLPLSFDLGKKLGEQFHLRLNYDAANDTIDVFVDDTCVARIQNAEFDNPFRNAKNSYPAMLQVGAYSRNDFVVNGKNGFDITVSNMSIGAQKVMDPARLMDGLTFATIKGTNEFQTAIYSDLDLVSSIPGPLLIPLTWSSDRPDIIGTDGKISKVTKDETVTLTAALTNDPSQTKSFKLIVRGPDAVYASAAKETAAFAKTAVTVDGVPNESGWRLAGRVLNKADTLVAEYGFLWNQTHLFAAVDFVDGVGPVVLTFNGHTFTVENGKLLENGAEVAGAVVAVGTNAVELSLPLSAIGMGSKISTYGKTMPVHVTAGGFDGPANTLTLSDIAWFTSFTRNNNPKSSSASQTKVTNNPPVEGYQGFTKLESGWRMYDLYNPNGANPAGVRTYVMYQNAGFNDRTAGTRLEFEFRADKMPLGIWDDPDFDLRSYSNAGFTFVFGTAADATKYSWAVTCGIVNTEEGLVFIMRNDAAHKIALDKNVGDTFNLAVQWNLDDTLDVYVDGVKKGSFAAASMWKLGAAAQSVVFNVVRNERLPGSSGPEDSYDVTISNLAFGNTYNEDAGLLGKLSFADIANGNPSADKVSSNLTLPTTITDGLLDNVYNITWSSSDEGVVTRTGVVTQPAVGIAFATLTATIDGHSKDFDLIIMGKSMDNSKVLHLVNDLDPAHGAGVAYNEMLFTFDTTNNSLIAVQDKSDRVNLVTLTDSDNKARLTAESLTLWVSDDNATYTQIRDFKLVHIGQKWYLYGFDARAKYVKVHYTQFRGAATSFTGAYGIMITAGYDASLVKAGTTEYTVTNNTTVQYDATLAVDGFTGDTARLRVFDKGGKLLYHYVDGGKLYVRYPELTVGSSAKVYVQQAAAGAIELASKENVYEITYGSREVYTDNSNTKNNRYILALPAGTKLANGTKLEQETVYAMGYKLMASTDGGRTWAIHSDVLNTAPMLKTPVERIGGSGAFTFDPHTGRMYFMCYWVSHPFEALDITLSHCEQMIIASDNGGKNWYLVDTLPRDIVNDPQSAYMLTYSGGTVLSTYDGKGPKVDIVFPMGSQYNNLGGFCTRVAYTKDGGESWQLSESLIIYPEPATNSENGTSEAYIQERDDGVLVLYTRCQYDSMDHFGVSYSLDSGVTWMEEVTTSKMYSTNTQATIRDYTVNGKTADLSIWGGNTALGGRSYTRNPLNVAVSANESETYRNIQNLFFESEMENYDYRNFTITNGTFEKVNETDMFITFGDLSGSRTFLRMFVQDFDKWFTRTRGGYDNFEHGTTQAEGWVVLEGGIDVSTANA